MTNNPRYPQRDRRVSEMSCPMSIVCISAGSGLAGRDERPIITTSEQQKHCREAFSMRPLGVMFHHFHDRVPPCGQGPLSADALSRMIKSTGPGRILSAREFLWRSQND